MARQDALDQERIPYRYLLQIFSRRIKTAKGAVDQGYVIAPYSDAVKLKLEQFYRREASTNLEDYIRNNVEKVTGDPTAKVKRRSTRKTAASQSRIFEKDSEPITNAFLKLDVFNKEEPTFNAYIKPAQTA